MKSDTFFKLVSNIKESRPIWFELESDPVPTDAELLVAQTSLGAKLPPEYIGFVKMFGGGYFAFANVYSACPGSDWNIVRRNRDIGLLSQRFVAFSDNGCGDYYGFRVDEGICRSPVCFYDHETLQIFSTGFSDMFEYLVDAALHGTQG